MMRDPHLSPTTYFFSSVMELCSILTRICLHLVKMLVTSSAKVLDLARFNRYGTLPIPFVHKKNLFSNVDFIPKSFFIVPVHTVAYFSL